MDFNLDNLLSQILYVLSGFFFGIFASRYSVLAWRHFCLALQRAGMACRPLARIIERYCAALRAASGVYRVPAVIFNPHRDGQLCVLRRTAFLFQQGH